MVAGNEMTDGEVMDATTAFVEWLTGEDMGPYTVSVSIKQALENMDRKGTLKTGADGAKGFLGVQVVRIVAGAIGVPKRKKLFENETTEYWVELR